MMDTLLRRLDAVHATFTVYTDDLILIVAGDTRAEIERRAQPLVDLVTQWSEDHHLQISSTKTIIGEVKGTFKGRAPTIKLAGSNFHLRRTFRYLGITFGSQLRISLHLESLQARSISGLSSLKKMAHSECRLMFPLMKVYYRTIFLVMVTYGADAWADLLTTQNTRHLLVIQRHMLLRMTKAYSTTFTESLQVMSGVLPLDLQLALRRREFLYRRQGFRRFGHIDLTDSLIPEDASKRLRKASLRSWEERWQLSELAPVTHGFLPSIAARTRMQWLPHHTQRSNFSQDTDTFNMNSGPSDYPPRHSVIAERSTHWHT